MADPQTTKPFSRRYWIDLSVASGVVIFAVVAAWGLAHLAAMLPL